MIEQLEAALAKTQNPVLAPFIGLSAAYQIYKYDKPQDGMTHSRVTLYPLKEFEAPTTQEAITLTVAAIESLVTDAEQKAKADQPAS